MFEYSNPLKYEGIIFLEYIIFYKTVSATFCAVTKDLVYTIMVIKVNKDKSQIIQEK
jgi:hypothetical protein